MRACNSSLALGQLCVARVAVRLRVLLAPCRHQLVVLLLALVPEGERVISRRAHDGRAREQLADTDETPLGVVGGVGAGGGGSRGCEDVIHGRPLRHARQLLQEGGRPATAWTQRTAGSMSSG